MKKIFFATLLLAGGAMADPAKVYEGLMSDTDLYVGEGVVSPSAYAGDMDRAKASGRERARGGLVEGIRVKISSSTTDTSNEKEEKFEAKSSSQADLELEDIEYKYLENYPKDGQLTVLAFLSKEKYRRQMANRGIRVGYHENGLKVIGGTGGMAWAEQSSTGGSALIGLDFSWRKWILGLSMADYRVYKFGSGQTQTLGQYRFQAGYDFVPWRTAFQPYIPLRLGYTFYSADPYFTNLFHAQTGLGFRYWIGDQVAFDFGGRATFGLNHAELVDYRDASNPKLGPSPGKAYDVSDTGFEIQAGLLWSAF